jgi:hypothetical protein
MATHTYNVTAQGHAVDLTVEGDGGPVLISFHGGGIVNGSRRDQYIPLEIEGTPLFV